MGNDCGSPVLVHHESLVTFKDISELIESTSLRSRLESAGNSHFNPFVLLLDTDCVRA